MTEYKITLRDAEGYNVGDCERLGRKEAIEHAKYMLTEEYARNRETTQADIGADRIEVENEKGEIVWSKQR